MTCQLLNMISPASGLLSYYCCSLPPASWSAGGTRTTRTLPRLFGTLVRVHCSGNSKGAVRRLQSLQFSPPLPAHCQVTAASACCPPAACPSAHNDVVFVLELIQQHQTPDACPSLVLPDPQAKAATTCCTAGTRSASCHALPSWFVPSNALQSTLRRRRRQRPAAQPAAGGGPGAEAGEQGTAGQHRGGCLGAYSLVVRCILHSRGQPALLCGVLCTSCTRKERYQGRPG